MQNALVTDRGFAGSGRQCNNTDASDCRVRAVVERRRGSYPPATEGAEIVARMAIHAHVVGRRVTFYLPGLAR